MRTGRGGITLERIPPALLRAALELVCETNAMLYRATRIPSIYHGIRWSPRRDATTIRTVLDVLASGEGDCAELSAARVGELRAAGVPAWCDVVEVRPGTAHVFIRTSTGIEDPSVAILSRHK